MFVSVLIPSLQKLPRFENSRNVEIRPKSIAGRMDDFFESFDKHAGFPVMVEPVTGFLTSSIVPNDVGRTEFGETDAGSGGEH